MKLVKYSKNLSQGMRISRGGFQKRTHWILTMKESDGIGLDITNSCDVIAEGQCINFDFNQIKFFLKSVYEEGRLESCTMQELEESCLRSETYPSRSSSKYALLAAASTTTQLLSLNLQVNPNTINRIAKDGYASNSYWLEDVDDMIIESKSLMDKGVQRIKHHVGVKTPQEEAVRCLRLMHKCLEYKPTSMHAFDLNCAYSYEEANTFIGTLEESSLRDHILWVEEPLHFNLYYRLKELQDNTSIPLAAGENATSVQELAELTGSIYMTMPDLGRNCNINDLSRLCKLSSHYRTIISPHNYGSQCLTQKTLKSFLIHKDLRYFEADLSDNPLRSDGEALSILSIIKNTFSESILNPSKIWISGKID